LQNFIGDDHHIYTSPAVVKLDTDKIKPFTATTYRLTFVGSENHYPNLDAINWFVKEIIPFLREQKTKFKLQIIGNWKSEFIKEVENQYPEVELVGFIEDLHSFLNGSILLVPIRIGSGMRMKILDGIIAHAPIITTTKGVEGLNFKNGSECIISDTPQEFANSIIHLLSNPILQEKLATQANKQLFTQYDQKEMLERRLKLYNKIFEEKD
jgi:glycosyltransferase involved in cell wall biosynthesis